MLRIVDGIGMSDALTLVPLHGPCTPASFVVVGHDPLLTSGVEFLAAGVMG